MWRGWVGIAGWTEDNEEVSSPEKSNKYYFPLSKEYKSPQLHELTQRKEKSMVQICLFN